MQLDKLADMVVLTIKTAIAPVLERVAAAEARLSVLGDLRDRVVTVETKAASMAAAPPAVVFDAAPLLARIAALEDRVLVAETKANMTPPVPETKDVDLSPMLQRVSAIELALQMLVAETQPLRIAVPDLTKEVSGLRERVAVAEVRALVPGPAGTNGSNGADGLNGKDGVDGLGWDDLSVEHDGERAFTIKMMRGERVKDAGTFTVPVQIYRGIYTEGRTYEPGDTVTYARSLWHCQKTTVLKPDGITRDPVTGEAKGAQGKDFWRLVAKGGADGRNGLDAPGALPVLKVGAR